MMVGIPGSLVLRSRLVAAQQRRLAGASSRPLAQWTRSTSSRLYSARSDAASRSREDDASADPPPSPSPSVPFLKYRSTSPAPKNAKDRRLEGELLMAIASPKAKEGSVQAPRLNKRIIDEELRWLPDPRKLGDRVHDLLREGDPAKAAALARAAPKQGIRGNAAWNYLIEYCLTRGHPDAALKFYNDMKKRGMMPNAWTYTSILAGFSKIPQSQKASPKLVNTAYAIYESISAPNSQVDRSIIHTNAMLNVCHRHRDMDMLWRVAADMPEEGPQAPDMTTYTIILTAIQFSARTDIQKMKHNDSSKIRDRKAQAVREAKRIWSDILYRCQNGHLQFDNHIVSTMAAVLLDGASDHDCYDVLRLYNQTMGIPIFKDKAPDIPKSSCRRIFSSDGSLSATQEEEDVPFVDETNQVLSPLEGNEKAEADAEEGNEEAFSHVFDPIDQATGQLTYPKPNNKDLTMIVSACSLMTQAIKAGVAYWRHLTMEDSNYRINPDAVSIYQYLRLLRLARNSGIALQTIQEQLVPIGQATSGKGFLIAMTICRRDRRNHNVFSTANKLLDLMGKSMVLPDPRVINEYLPLIRILSDKPEQLISQLKHFGVKGRQSNLPELGQKLQARLRMAAVVALRPHIEQLYEAMLHWKPIERDWISMRTNFFADGPVAAKTMARTRLLIDEALNKDYAPFISNEEREMLETLSKKLRMYSDKEVIEKFNDRHVYPTVEQRNAFIERQRRVDAEDVESPDDDSWRAV